MNESTARSMELHAAPWLRHARICVTVALMMALFSLGLPTLLHALGAERLAHAIALPWALVCHQLPERTLVLAGHPMPVCSRCAGLWCGLLVAAMVRRPVLPLHVLRWVLCVAGALMLFDVMFHPFAFSHAWRFVSGAAFSVPFGGTMGAMIARELSSREDRSLHQAHRQ